MSQSDAEGSQPAPTIDRKVIVEKLRNRVSEALNKRPELRVRLLKYKRRTQIFLGLVVAGFIAYHGLLFYIDHPAEHAIQIEIAKGNEVLIAPEVVLGDGPQNINTNEKPKAPEMPAMPVDPAPKAPVAQSKAAEPMVPPAAPILADPPPAKSPSTYKIQITGKSKFPKTLNKKSAMAFFKKAFEVDTDCFPKLMKGKQQVRAFVKAAPNGTVVAVSVVPVHQEKRKIASVKGLMATETDRNFSKAAACLKKQLGAKPAALKSKAKKNSTTELILHLQ